MRMSQPKKGRTIDFGQYNTSTPLLFPRKVTAGPDWQLASTTISVMKFPFD